MTVKRAPQFGLDRRKPTESRRIRSDRTPERPGTYAEMRALLTELFIPSYRKA